MLASRVFSALFLALELSVSSGRMPAQAPERFDLLIAGGAGLDGTGAPAQRLDVGILGDRIVALAASLPRTNAARAIDSTGRIVSPGFIDWHAYPEPLLLLPLMASAL